MDTKYWYYGDKLFSCEQDTAEMCLPRHKSRYLEEDGETVVKNEYGMMLVAKLRKGTKKTNLHYAVLSGGVFWTADADKLNKFCYGDDPTMCELVKRNVEIGNIEFLDMVFNTVFKPTDSSMFTSHITAYYPTTDFSGTNDICSQMGEGMLDPKRHGVRLTLVKGEGDNVGCWRSVSVSDKHTDKSYVYTNYDVVLLDKDGVCVDKRHIDFLESDGTRIKCVSPAKQPTELRKSDICKNISDFVWIL